MTKINLPFDAHGLSGLYVASPWNDEYYAVGAADWAQAGSQIFVLDCDNEWSGTQYQVADFLRPRDALQQHIRDVIIAGGEGLDDEAKAEIDQAVDKAIANIPRIKNTPCIARGVFVGTHSNI